MSVTFSSRRHDWETPPEIFEPLHAEFRFTLDAAASADNAKAPLYYTVEDDGLACFWGDHTVWLNPPYGRKVGRWVKKAYRASQMGATVVVLIFARTDTRWWHDWVQDKAEIRFLRGRIRFLDHTGAQRWSAPAPSCVLVYRPAVSAAEAP